MCKKKGELLAKLKKMSVNQRKELIERVYIRFPKIKDLLAKMRHCLEFSKISAEPECMVIKGPLGSGKTTLVKAFARDYPRQVTMEKTIVPVLMVRIPVPASVKGLATKILEAFGDKAFDKGSTVSQTIRLREYIHDCETRLIVFDEFQHFIDRDSLKVLRTLSDWLKNLIDETKAPIIVVGMPSCDAVLDESENEQLRRRFATRECLDPFGWTNAEQRKEFRSFLKLLDEQLPLLECSHLSDFNMAYLIHQATGGTIAYVMKLIRMAASLALDEGLEKLDRNLLAEAYEELLAKNKPTMPNPFDITTASPKRFKHKRDRKSSSPRRTTNKRVRGRKREPTASDVLRRR